jgi:hypothetical protein
VEPAVRTGMQDSIETHPSPIYDSIKRGIDAQDGVQDKKVTGGRMPLFFWDWTMSRELDILSGMTTPPSPESYRNELLAQLAAITTLERGTLSEEYREVPAPDGPGTLRLGPYFKHQCWEGGKNRSSRVPASCVAALREDLENGRRFEQIISELSTLAIESGRARRAALSQKALPAELIEAKKNSSKKASRKGIAKPKPS